MYLYTVAVSHVSLSCVDYELMADNTLFRLIIDFIGRHISRARAKNGEELHLRLTGKVVSSVCTYLTIRLLVEQIGWPITHVGIDYL